MLYRNIPLFCAVGLSAAQLFAAPIPVATVSKDASGITLQMTPGLMRLEVFSPRSIHVSYTPLDKLPDPIPIAVIGKPLPTKWKESDTRSEIVLHTDEVEARVNRKSGAVQFFDAAGHLLLGEPADGGKAMTPATVNRETSFQPQQVFESAADEYIYGLGSFQEGIWNWRGMPQQLRQLNTQISIPMIVSSRGYGLMWNNASLSDFNPVDTRVDLVNGTGTFTTGPAGDYVFMVKDGDRRNQIGVQVNGQTLAAINNMWVPYTISAKAALPANTPCTVTLMGGGRNAKIFAGPRPETTTFRSEVGDMIDYYFFYGPNTDDIIAGYRQATGDAPLFPEAAYGFWQCRERYSSQQQIVAAAREFRARNIPVDFIVQDWQYWGNHGWGAYEWDTNSYPNPARMIADLHSNHLRYMISVWSNPSGIVAQALRSIPNSVLPGSWMDVFNPAVRSLRWKYMNSAFFGIGADAWWQDATEPGDDGNSVNNAKTYLGSANRVRNSYPLFASEATYEGQRSADPSKRVVTLSRSSYLGQQRYAAAAWSGDIHGDWVTFARQIPAGLNFSITGLPYWTTDTGGFFHPGNQYRSSDYNELLTRWYQFSTFSPILRIHGNGTSTEIWNWLPATQTNLIAFDELRHRLLPYNYSVAWKITSQSYTPMRALVMDFPKDTAALAVADEYMFGPAFLASPVTTAQATSRPVYLPSGAKWVDFWSGETQAGGKTVTADAPISILPLFVRAGSIVPMGPVVQYATEKPEDPIELRVYRGANGEFTIYEDEDDNYNYEKGAHATIPISWNEAKHTLSIGKREGTFPGMLNERTFNVVWVSSNHGVGNPATEKPDSVVHYNGDAMKVVAP